MQELESRDKKILKLQNDILEMTDVDHRSMAFKSQVIGYNNTNSAGNEYLLNTSGLDALKLDSEIEYEPQTAYPRTTSKYYSLAQKSPNYKSTVAVNTDRQKIVKSPQRSFERRPKSLRSQTTMHQRLSAKSGQGTVMNNYRHVSAFNRRNTTAAAKRTLDNTALNDTKINQDQNKHQMIYETAVKKNPSLDFYAPYAFKKSVDTTIRPQMKQFLVTRSVNDHFGNYMLQGVQKKNVETGSLRSFGSHSKSTTLNPKQGYETERSPR